MKCAKAGFDFGKNKIFDESYFGPIDYGTPQMVSEATCRYCVTRSYHDGTSRSVRSLHDMVNAALPNPEPAAISHVMR